MDCYILVATFALMLLDYGTGVIQAVANKNLNSTKMREGLFHKTAFILVIVLAVIIEITSQHVDIGFGMLDMGGWLFRGVCAWVCVTEVISVLENLGKMNGQLADSKLLGFFESVYDAAKQNEPKHGKDGENAKGN